MLKKILTTAIICCGLYGCASWWGSSSSNSSAELDSPTVGSKDSSDMLFGQAAVEPTKQQASQPTAKTINVKAASAAK